MALHIIYGRKLMLIEEKYSLRERKHAQTKIALVNAFIDKLQTTRFDDIMIQEICHSVQVSEGTFFNYFHEKVDIVLYYTHLLLVKIIWKAQKENKSKKYLDLINTIFEITAEELKNLNVIYQIISTIIIQNEKPRNIVISNIEKQSAFPDCPNIEKIPSWSIDESFKEYLKKAVKNGELPKNTNTDDVLISLITIMIGTLLIAKTENIQDINYHYKRQIQYLWQGLGIKHQIKGKIIYEKT